MLFWAKIYQHTQIFRLRLFLIINQMSDFLRYCHWYKDTDINEIPDKAKKDNVPLKYRELFRSLCIVGIGQELLANLVQLEKACKYFLEHGTKSTNVYNERLKKIQNLIENY